MKTKNARSLDPTRNAFDALFICFMLILMISMVSFQNARIKAKEEKILSELRNERNYTQPKGQGLETALFVDDAKPLETHPGIREILIQVDMGHLKTDDAIAYLDKVERRQYLYSNIVLIIALAVFLGIFLGRMTPISERWYEPGADGLLLALSASTLPLVLSLVASLGFPDNFHSHARDLLHYLILGLSLITIFSFIRATNWTYRQHRRILGTTEADILNLADQLKRGNSPSGGFRLESPIFENEMVDEAPPQVQAEGSTA